MVLKVTSVALSFRLALTRTNTPDQNNVNALLKEEKKTCAHLQFRPEMLGQLCLLFPNAKVVFCRQIPGR